MGKSNGVEHTGLKGELAELGWVAGLTGLAALLRFYALDRLPPGLYHDEAFNGLDALRVLAGERPLYFEANNGREPFFIYCAAASIALWGRSPGAIRFAAALLGTLTVPATYLMAREMFGQRVAMLTAALAATSFWALNLSRVGFRAVTLPLFVALTLWSLWRGWRRGSWRAWAVAGLFCGASLYTYLAARFTVTIWALLAIYILACGGRAERRQLLAFALVASLVAAPLAWYASHHVDVFFGRATQVTIFSPDINRGDPLGTLLRQVAKALAMFVYRGDFIPRHNMPYRAVFDPLLAPFFIWGVLFSARRWRDQAYGFILVWLGVMLWPTILAEGAPHFLRAVGVLPVAFLFPALGLNAGYRYLQTKGVRLAWVPLVLLLAASAVWTISDYFGRHVRSEAVYYNFESAATELAARVNRFLGQGWNGRGLLVRDSSSEAPVRVYIDRRLWDGWASLRYLIPAEAAPLVSQVIVWDEGELPERDSVPEDTMLVCWPYGNYRPALALLPSDAVITVQEGGKERGDLEREARLLYVAFTARLTRDVPRNVGQRFGQRIALLGYAGRLLAADRLQVSLYWQAEETPSEEWTVFVHVRRGEQMLGQDDGPPGHGYYPTKLWRPRDIVVDEHTITVSSPLSEADRLWIGLYRLETGERLSLMAGQDHVELPLP